MASAGDLLDPARPHRDEEQHVQPPQPDRVDSEEVAGEDRVSLLAQERSPARGAALRCRRYARTGEHVAYQRRGNGDPELAQFTDDPHIAPVAVLPREAQD